MTDILVVEDNAELREVLVDFLRNEGYTVSSAGDGDKALALYEKYGARLLVLDIMLPELNGLEVLRRIRAVSTIPVILETARGETIDKITLKAIAHQKFCTSKLSSNALAIKITSASITKMNNPSVSKVTGSEKSTSKGFTTAFSIPMTAAIMIDDQKSRTSTPGSR